MSRLNEVEKKYSNIDWKTWKAADPTKNNKYLDWIGAHQVELESPGKTKELLIRFDKNIAKLEVKDIIKYTPKTLVKALDDAGKSIKECKKDGADLIGEVDGAKIYFLKDFEAAKKYVAGTKWCISNKETFYSYCRTHNLFLIIKNDEKAMTITPFNRRYDEDEIYLSNDYQLDYKDPFEYQRKNINLLFKFFGMKFPDVTFVKHVELCKKFTEKTKNPIGLLNTVNSVDKLNDFIKNNSVSTDQFDSFLLSKINRKYNSGKYTYESKFLPQLYKQKDKFPELFSLVKASTHKEIVSYLSSLAKEEKKKLEAKKKQELAAKEKRKQEKLTKLLESKDLLADLQEFLNAKKAKSAKQANKPKVPAAGKAGKITVKPKKVNT